MNPMPTLPDITTILISGLSEWLAWIITGIATTGGTLIVKQFTQFIQHERERVDNLLKDQNSMFKELIDKCSKERVTYLEILTKLGEELRVANVQSTQQTRLLEHLVENCNKRDR